MLSAFEYKKTREGRLFLKLDKIQSQVTDLFGTKSLVEGPQVQFSQVEGRKGQKFVVLTISIIFNNPLSINLTS